MAHCVSLGKFVEWGLQAFALTMTEREIFAGLSASCISMFRALLCCCESKPSTQSGYRGWETAQQQQQFKNYYSNYWFVIIINQARHPILSKASEEQKKEILFLFVARHHRSFFFPGAEY